MFNTGLDIVLLFYCYIMLKRSVWNKVMPKSLKQEEQ